MRPTIRCVDCNTWLPLTHEVMKVGVTCGNCNKVLLVGKKHIKTGYVLLTSK
jgi:phage FluMu protein Com